MDLPVNKAVQLSLSERQQLGALHYQVLTIELTRRDRLINPVDLPELTLPPGVDTTGGVVISGRAPIWLYAHLVHELHPTAWIACYDPRLGAVVVATHSTQTQIGQVLPLTMVEGALRSSLCPAVMLVGPPDSGKSVLAHALFQALLPICPDIFLQRAHWDGEGNWILELPVNATERDRETFKQLYKGDWTDDFFPHHADAILNLRRQKRLVLVDVGGKVDLAKGPLLEACSHYLVVSSDPQAVTAWHHFCRDRGNLKPLAVVQVTPHQDGLWTVQQGEPYLRLALHPKWLQTAERLIPPPLVESVRGVLA